MIRICSLFGDYDEKLIMRNSRKGLEKKMTVKVLNSLVEICETFPELSNFSRSSSYGQENFSISRVRFIRKLNLEYNLECGRF